MGEGVIVSNHVGGSTRVRRSMLGPLIGKLSGAMWLSLLLLATATGLVGCVACPVAPAPVYSSPYYGPYYGPNYGPAYVYGPNYYYGPRYYHPYYGCRGRC
jgi:hypothetical protein